MKSQNWLLLKPHTKVCKGVQVIFNLFPLVHVVLATEQPKKSLVHYNKI